MCQVIPFTLPCCRRLYVSISRLPSCPASWPKAKCPAELCIQIRGTEPEERSTGTCWRCKANAAGRFGAEMERLAPAINRAHIVIGLDELGIVGRRQMVEAGGNCWFCNAKGGCVECGAKEIKYEEEIQNRLLREETPTKKRHRDVRLESHRGTRKRIKGEGLGGPPSTPDSVYSLPNISVSNPGYSLASHLKSELSYPDPGSPTNWNSHSYPGSPYPPSPLYNSVSYETYDSPATLSNRHLMFNSTNMGSWQTSLTAGDWSNYPDHDFTAAPQATGNTSYTPTPQEAQQQPVDMTVDPDLLQPKVDPDMNSIAPAASSLPWIDDPNLFQDNYTHLDPAAYDNNSIQQAYEREMQQHWDLEDVQGL